MQRDGRTVRSLGYSLEMDNYTSTDLSIMAEHLFRDAPVRCWAYQQAPWSIVWVVMANGKLLALTLNQEHQVAGWGRHDLGGQVADVCSIPGAGAGQDDVYFAVRRGSGMVVERLGRRTDSLSESLWKDAGQHPVSSVVELLEWEQQVNGTLQGRHKGMLIATIRMLSEAEIWAGVMTENNQELDLVRFSPETSPYIADARIELPGGMGRQCRLKIEHTRPEPLTILGIFPEVVVDAEEN